MLDRLPPVAYRLGADLDPVDLSTDPWLEAFIWPEQVAELQTLRAAIHLARREPPPLVRADAVWDTARLIAQVPGRIPVVVFTASLLSYLDAGARARFVAQLTVAARERPVAWLFTEAPGLVAAPDNRRLRLPGPRTVERHCVDRMNHPTRLLSKTL